MISFVFEGRRTKIPTYDLVFQKSASDPLLEYARVPLLHGFRLAVHMAMVWKSQALKVVKGGTVILFDRRVSLRLAPLLPFR